MSSRTASADAPARTPDLLTLGRRIRHFRLQRGLTLEQLGAAVGATASQLSLVENGHREPRLALLTALAQHLSVAVADLLAAEPPSRRAALEIALDAAQRSPLYAGLGLPAVRPARSLPTEALEALVGLHGELRRRAEASIATPEEARRANTELRQRMRARDNHLPDLEALAEEQLRAAGHTAGPLTHRTVARMAGNLGLTLIHVDDLPHSTRTVTDLQNGRIYLPPASIPGGHGLRSLALQAMAHRLLEHSQPTDYADFLRQRMEINYYAAACLVPRTPALALLSAAKAAKDLAVEDLRDAFGITHETAAWRLTNLATHDLGFPVHFLRVGEDGALYKGYENDGVGLPTDPSGAVEGQLVCRSWAARAVFGHTERATEYHQYTDTPNGTYWCTSQTGSTSTGRFSISVGVPYAHAKWFRGRDTTARSRSRCPDEACCRRPAAPLAQRWAPHAWPSAAMHAHILAPLPSGTFPGVDDTEVYSFLERHTAER
ncbi:helix-turn-helix domain-containing protein [Quadrisphaera sp. DSM 44207]|uniref:helix-turn-helix domain-containing protein n=1 Tax=Quadrisphaera sp. DSM 44207 TaxID=1881057 RepID=UPI00089238D5|nr:helix-turn-helix domain-containing protein [Quadrisphaera sp. DSM 44207]SDQ63879.1 transcriptional regulator [Quadrisphaera sp. DSM 44207]